MTFQTMSELGTIDMYLLWLLIGSLCSIWLLWLAEVIALADTQLKTAFVSISKYSLARKHSKDIGRLIVTITGQSELKRDGWHDLVCYFNTWRTSLWPPDWCEVWRPTNEAVVRYIDAMIVHKRSSNVWRSNDLLAVCQGKTRNSAVYKAAILKSICAAI